MTGTELLNLALPLMFSADASEYTIAALPVINLMLADCFDINNSLRIDREIAALTAIPEITALSETLPYEDAINKKILAYGLAGYLCSEDNPSESAQYKNKYEYEKSRTYVVQYEQIEDLTESDL